MNINLITCKDHIVISSIIQSYALHWYHNYLFPPRNDKTKAMIFQQLYCTSIIKSIQKEVKIPTLTNVQKGQIKI